MLIPLKKGEAISSFLKLPNVAKPKTWTATGREHIACRDSSVSQILKLIICNGEEILSNVNLVVRV